MSVRSIQALILAPTRELANDIHNVIQDISHDTTLESYVCIGDANIRQEMAKLKEGVHVVVGSPCRVFDMIERRALCADRIKIFGLGHADELWARGFGGQIHDSALLKRLSSQSDSDLSCSF